MSMHELKRCLVLNSSIAASAWIVLIGLISSGTSAYSWHPATKGRNEATTAAQDPPRIYLSDLLRQSIAQREAGRPDGQTAASSTNKAVGQEDIEESLERSSEWETVLEPKLYVLTEFAEGEPELEEVGRRRRRNAQPSLSIVNPLDVLRQRLLFEIARRRMKESHSQIMANNEILKNIGRK